MKTGYWIGGGVVVWLVGGALVGPVVATIAALGMIGFGIYQAARGGKPQSTEGKGS